jgi:hypothetical protein
MAWQDTLEATGFAGAPQIIADLTARAAAAGAPDFDWEAAVERGIAVHKQAFGITFTTGRSTVSGAEDLILTTPGLSINPGRVDPGVVLAEEAQIQRQQNPPKKGLGTLGTVLAIGGIAAGVGALAGAFDAVGAAGADAAAGGFTGDIAADSIASAGLASPAAAVSAGISASDLLTGARAVSTIAQASGSVAQAIAGPAAPALGAPALTALPGVNQSVQLVPLASAAPASAVGVYPAGYTGLGQTSGAGGALSPGFTSSAAAGGLSMTAEVALGLGVAFALALVFRLLRG